jgi:hypothetical protein
MPVVNSITATEPRSSDPGASHMPPAAVTSTIMVMRGFVSATRSRTVSIMVAGRVAVVIVRAEAGATVTPPPNTVKVPEAKA